MISPRIEPLLATTKVARADCEGRNRGRCVNYFTRRIILILMETIKELYIRAPTPTAIRCGTYSRFHQQRKQQHSDDERVIERSASSEAPELATGLVAADCLSAALRSRYRRAERKHTRVRGF